ncbi:hypothetical protein V2J09_000144, partial [Rumex salicifolius]
GFFSIFEQKSLKTTRETAYVAGIAVSVGFGWRNATCNDSVFVKSKRPEEMANLGDEIESKPMEEDEEVMEEFVDLDKLHTKEGILLELVINIVVNK